MSTIIELQEKRASLVKQARSVLERSADKMPEGDDRTQYDNLTNEIANLGDRILAEERQLEQERLTAAIPEPRAATREPVGTPAPEDRKITAEKERRAAFRKFLASGNDAEYRALAMDSDPAGGFLFAPQDFVASIIEFVKDRVWMREFGTVMTVTNAESLGIPTLDADPADSDWTAEIGTGNADSTMKFGKRELRPHPLAKQIKVSQKLLRASTLDAEALVIDRLSYKFAVTAEKAYLNGTGNQQPLGVFTASSDGIDTSRDVSTGNTATAIGAGNLFEVKYTLKANYWPNAKWVFHRTGLKQLMKLTDTNGQYLWVTAGMTAQRGLGAGQPDVLLDCPVYLSEYAPSTFTTGLYVGVFGDFSKYWIADSLSMQFQRLVELYAATAQVGFIGRLETDGMPVLAEAFARVKLA